MKVLNFTPRPFCTVGKSPAVHCKGGGYVTSAGLDVLKKKKPLVPTGIRTQGLPAVSWSIRQIPSNYMSYNPMQLTVLWAPFHVQHYSLSMSFYLRRIR